MKSLSDFPITNKWPATEPQVLQLYSRPTPNGIKVSVLLEEIRLPYESHLISFADADQHTPEFLSLNPNNKIPAIIDPNGPNGEAVGIFESGAILLYLAETSGQFLPKSGCSRYEVLQWLMWQIGGLGPMFGQLGFFHKFAGKEFEDKRPRDRYVDEAKRLLSVLEKQLDGREWIAGDYSIADISVAPWLRAILGAYDAGVLIEIENYPIVQAYLARFLERPAVQRGLLVPS